jgi:carbamoyltransferase
MIICGIKLTHDGAVALIDNGKLIFCHEMEKIANNPRFTDIKDFKIIRDFLKQYNYSLKDVDKIVIDGWDHTIQTKDGDMDLFFEVAKYGSLVINHNLLEGKHFSNSAISLEYSSYMHISGHALGAYCTSPFAKKTESSFILVWDGSMCPQLFYYDVQKNNIENLKPLFLLNGHVYSAFGHRFEPFRSKHDMEDMNIAGKLMAYIALGTLKKGLLDEFWNIYKNDLKDKNAAISTQFIDKCVYYGEVNGYKSEDMMCTFHVFLEELLINTLEDKVSSLTNYTKNLCFAGGCALNIKWNSAIRSSELFNEIWVPPFPNDSGSAIGAACCEMVNSTGRNDLEWCVYLGPFIENELVSSEWNEMTLSVKELANLIHTSNEPVVLLHGRAELGPRALGNRSIISSAVSPSTKEILNLIKNREGYRPVAPICIEEDAPEIFDPGTPDPYMLYDHKLRDGWQKKIPAICHLDGTARLQTIGFADNPVIFELLTEYKKLSGLPVLCNTSANFNGRGFFPDVASAVEWGKVNFVWSEKKMFYRKTHEIFLNEKIDTQETVNLNDDKVILEF